jgi:hypothetical protein
VVGLTQTDLDDKGIYYYVAAAGSGTFFFLPMIAVMCAHGTLMACCLSNEDFSRAIDLEVIKMRTSVPSETTQTHKEFCTDSLDRDVRCVWTGADTRNGTGLHIIPYRRGSEVRSILLYWEDI